MESNSISHQDHLSQADLDRMTYDELKALFKAMVSKGDCAGAEALLRRSTGLESFDWFAELDVNMMLWEITREMEDEGQLAGAAYFYGLIAGRFDEMLDPDSSKRSAIFNDLGLALEKLGHYEDAEKAFWKAVDGKDGLTDFFGVPAVLDNLACMLARRGQYGRACAIFQRALEEYERLWPNGAGAQALRARLEECMARTGT